MSSATEPLHAARPAGVAVAQTAPEAEPVERLIGILLARNLCDVRMLDRARRVSEESGRRVDAVLTQLGIVAERSMAECYAELLGTSVVTPDRYPDEPILPERLKPRFLRHVHALPITLGPGGMILALTDPLDRFTPAAISAAAKCRVDVVAAVPIELEAALDRLYPDGGLVVDRADGGEAHEPFEDADRLKDLASEAPVIRLVNGIIARAAETRASDIHVEPFEDRLRVRYRYDGVLHEADSPPARLTAAITSRIKIMARLDIAERRLPQDGRIQFAVRGQEIDFRVSTIPSLHGETVVLRVLDRNAVSFRYDTLGLAAPVVERFSRTLELPNGIVLVTGPTGSGKTTTLYTGLLGLNSVARKIVTVEDPIEYHLQGINQTQVKPQIGLSFSTLLRSIVRQDPDVVMVGEIRDGETAQIAVQAALMGRLVLSTVHTNSAAATITRLRDIGLEDYLITSVLRGVLAQRLVRRLCPHCRREAVAPSELVTRFALDSRRPPPLRGRPVTLWHPVGCAQCRSTGFAGRQAIAEFLIPTPEVERLIFGRADHSEIERAAVEAGMVTMFDAGMEAALAGTTTVEEVVRSIRTEG